MIADDAGVAAVLAVGGSLVFVLAAELFAATDAGPAGHLALLAGWVNGLASLVALVGILVAGWLVGLLGQAYSSPAKRKSIGSFWDVGTFWPRALHPLAPPGYSTPIPPARQRRLVGPAGDGRIYAVAATSSDHGSSPSPCPGSAIPIFTIISTSPAGIRSSSSRTPTPPGRGRIATPSGGKIRAPTKSAITWSAYSVVALKWLTAVIKIGITRCRIGVRHL